MKPLGLRNELRTEVATANHCSAESELGSGCQFESDMTEAKRNRRVEELLQLVVTPSANQLAAFRQGSTQLEAKL